MRTEHSVRTRLSGILKPYIGGGVDIVVQQQQLQHIFGESGLLENEPTAPAEQVHTTRRQ